MIPVELPCGCYDGPYQGRNISLRCRDHDHEPPVKGCEPFTRQQARIQASLGLPMRVRRR